ncbi:MAG: CDP-diacylglycerol--glycerol-3-phosphate 3-phosphatidyltransferase [Ruminococcus sp.]|nr:CDP-diacylglycerol--glycerol-3-phosphate 3-phosphatidyltransferase [Ruminococcus sp.]MBQ7133940.1 CDP-diacylglycerol--glycerol-3-phosphate 3-phosphatidyltransferase [Ruminococcus sp.]
MNLPNKLTVLRIILVPFMVAAMLIDFPFHYLVAGLIFGAASITDYFDGKIARERNLITNFGKFADPIADKILVISALVCFLAKGLCDPIIILIVLFREFVVTSVRLSAASQGKVVAANIWGKAKTVSQIIAIIGVFVLQILLGIFEQYLLINFDYYNLAYIFYIAGEVMMWISVLFAVISGVKYVLDNKDTISEM